MDITNPDELKKELQERGLSFSALCRSINKKMECKKRPLTKNRSEIDSFLKAHPKIERISYEDLRTEAKARGLHLVDIAKKLGVTTALSKTTFIPVKHSYKIRQILNSVPVLPDFDPDTMSRESLKAELYKRNRTMTDLARFLGIHVRFFHNRFGNIPSKYLCGIREYLSSHGVVEPSDGLDREYVRLELRKRDSSFIELSSCTGVSFIRSGKNGKIPATYTKVVLDFLNSRPVKIDIENKMTLQELDFELQKRGLTRVNLAKHLGKEKIYGNAWQKSVPQKHLREVMSFLDSHKELDFVLTKANISRVVSDVISKTGLDCKDLSKIVGTIPETIHRWHKGESLPRPHHYQAIRKLERILGVKGPEKFSRTSIEINPSDLFSVLRGERS